MPARRGLGAFAAERHRISFRARIVGESAGGQYDDVYLKTQVIAVEARPKRLIASFKGPKGPATDTFDMTLVAVGTSRC